MDNHCTAGCDSAEVVVTKPVTVTVADSPNTPFPNLAVYAYDGDDCTGYSAVTNAESQATFTLLQGSYRGLGDRLSQNGVNYTLDLNAGLTQVLSDGTT